MALKNRDVEIPTAENCVLALHQDFTKRSETIVLGGMTDVRLFLQYNKKRGWLSARERPLGAFLEECFDPLVNEMGEIRVGLLNEVQYPDPENLARVEAILSKLYLSDNFAHQFLALRIWEEYQRVAAAYAALRKRKEGKVKLKLRKTEAAAGRRPGNEDEDQLLEPFAKTLEDLTLPFCFSIQQNLMRLQKEHARYAMHYLPREYYALPGGLLWAGDADTSEYGFCTVSLMPLITYSLKQLYANKLFFQNCKLCGKLFLAGSANIPTFCSESCKREQGRLNKQKFDRRSRELGYEKEHKNTYMFLLRSVTRMKKNAAGSERIAAAQRALAEFCLEARQRKAQVKAGDMPERNFIGWLLHQRDGMERIEKAG